MSGVEFEDVSGTPRPEADIRAAIRCVMSEMVKNPMAMSKDGEPLLMHYIVIREALQELLELRAKNRMGP